MQQQANSTGSSIGRSLDDISLPRLREYCEENEFARRWIAECSPQSGDLRIRIGVGCDPLRLEDIEWHHQNDEQGRNMFDHRLMYIGIAGDGETFVVAMESGKVYLMNHQWTTDEMQFEECVSKQWEDVPAFLDALGAEQI